jgi:hypothetical protein
MYGSSYMFRYYIAIFKERSQCFLKDAQLRSSRYNIVDGRVVFSDVVLTQFILFCRLVTISTELTSSELRNFSFGLWQTVILHIGNKLTNALIKHIF